MKDSVHPVFIDPTTDEGFKRLFGDKTNLINFLNIIFRGRKVIVDLIYRDTERVGSAEDIGTVIFDLVVETSTGQEIIIEMQTSHHSNLKKRMLYYASKVISDKAPHGGRRSWAYALPEVYTIILMDGFHMPDSTNDAHFHDICLCDRDSGEIFYEGLGFIYMELINFVKGEGELESDLDKVFFMLKNMSRLKTLPRILNSDVFQRFFQLARYAKLTKEERHMYDISLKRKWDAEAVRQAQEEQRQALEEDRQALEEQRQALLVKQEALEQSKQALEDKQQVVDKKQQIVDKKERALEEALVEAESKAYAERLETARKMLSKGYDKFDICELLGLSAEEVEALT
ncbi:Rpn family recombination-promoting nuclease/putative transposase [Sphingobacterium alkalisoli]|nr:Rpn family recombination-promoting nuclease/putative transposase [Sphingobacterium alkalisoli]